MKCKVSTIPPSTVTASVRGYCERVESKTTNETKKRAPRARVQALPSFALVFDTETTMDSAQRLTFGSYALLQRAENMKTYDSLPIARGFFYPDGPGVSPDVPARLTAIANSLESDGPPFDVLSQTNFLEYFFRIAYKERGLIVAFNLQFDLSRAARHATEARTKGDGDFSLIFWPKTRAGRAVLDEKGAVIDRPYRPRIIVKSLGPHKAAIRFTSIRHPMQLDDILKMARRLVTRIERGSVVAPWTLKADAELFPSDRYARHLLEAPKSRRNDVERQIREDYLSGQTWNIGRFLDLHTLGHALTDRSLTLRSACTLFGVKPKGEVAEHPGWNFDRRYVEYNVNDVESTTELLNAMLTQYALHPIALEPDRAFSSATIGKAYLRAMGATPLLERWPDFPREALGIATSAYYGGRTSVRIRRAIMPVVYTDYMSMYPTVNALLGTVDLLRAANTGVIECTDEVRTLLATLTVDALFDSATWRQLSFFAQVELDGSGVFPVRAVYEHGDAPRIGMVQATSETAVWYAGPDIVASLVLTGVVPKIRRAISIEPQRDETGEVALHPGLTPIDFMGSVPIDPRCDDIFARVIEERQRIKADPSRSPEEKKRLDRGLKVFANGTGYGVWSETNVADDEHEATVRVASGDETFEVLTDAPEDAGPFSFMPIGSLITAGAHLMLALLERCVTDRGGSYVLEDTDSLAIVATEHGGRVPCPNGPLPWSAHDRATYGGPRNDAQASVLALSWADVDAIAQRFASLSPYDPSAVPGSILKVEALNFRPDRTQRQVFAFAVSSKRYAMFELGASGEPVFGFTVPGDDIVTQYSESGLGALAKPLEDVTQGGSWIEGFWRVIVREQLGLARETPTWFDRPVVARLPVSSPVTWRAFASFNAGKSYDDSVKPYSFGLTARLAIGTHDAVADASASLPHWMKMVQAHADTIYENLAREAEPYRTALAAIGGRIAPPLVAGREHDDFDTVLTRYKKPDRMRPQGTFPSFVAALRNELPHATNEDAMAFLRTASQTRKEVLARARKQFAHLRPNAEHPNTQMRVFGPACPSDRWLDRAEKSPWFNAYTGSPCDLSLGDRDPYDTTSVKAAQFEQLSYHHARHPESKSVCADGAPCTLDRSEYCGPLYRRRVHIGATAIVGKESQAFGDEVATALGELVEDDGIALGVLRAACSEPNDVFQNASVTDLARASRTSRNLVRALRDGKAAPGTPGALRIRAVAIREASSPRGQKRHQKKRATRARAARAESLYETQSAIAAPYWAALEAVGLIVPDLMRIAGRWQKTREFAHLPKTVLRPNISKLEARRLSPRRYKLAGNLDQLVTHVRTVDANATRESVLAFFATHRRRISKTGARKAASVHPRASS